MATHRRQGRRLRLSRRRVSLQSNVMKPNLKSHFSLYPAVGQKDKKIPSVSFLLSFPLLRHSTDSQTSIILPGSQIIEVKKSLRYTKAEDVIAVGRSVANDGVFPHKSCHNIVYVPGL